MGTSMITGANSGRILRVVGLGSRHIHGSAMRFNQVDKRVVLGEKILRLVPKFLKPYTLDFIKKPVRNLTSFLILHELTAIGPLVGLWYLFHKYQVHIPLDLPQWALDKGTKIIDDLMKSFDFNGFTLNDKFKLITEGAYAFVVVKMLMPVRLAISFGLTPFFTKYIVDPVVLVFSRKPPGEVPTKVNVKKVDKPRL